MGDGFHSFFAICASTGPLRNRESCVVATAVVNHKTVFFSKRSKNMEQHLQGNRQVSSLSDIASGIVYQVYSIIL